MELVYIVIWLVLAAAVAGYAKGKGLEPAVYFLAALFLSPVVGFIIVAAQQPNVVVQATASGKKKCPDCAEYVQPDALVCRFCGRRFDGDAATPTNERPDAPQGSETDSAANDAFDDTGEGGGGTSIVAIVAVVALVLVSLFYVTEKSRAAREEMQAIKTVDSVALTVENWKNPAGGRRYYPESLAQAVRVDEVTGRSIDAFIGGLRDENSGTSHGYTFSYIPIPDDRGRIVTYAVSAVPVGWRLSRRSFMADAAFEVVRFEADGSEPSVLSPELQPLFSSLH